LAGAIEAAITSNIFVWEANSTGIDRWNDGMEWNVQEEDGFEVGEAADGSGLMRKTIRIPDSRCFHHVVSYYNGIGCSNLGWAIPNAGMPN
jgi:hypothetical protein